MNGNKFELVVEQIESIQHEILLSSFVFSFVNCFSLFFLSIIFGILYTNPDTDGETYIKFLECAASLFAPYLTLAIQGFFYPKFRKINSLSDLLYETDEFSEEQVKILYDR